LVVISCIGCYYSYSIELLLASRFVQAFGGSVGSVLSQGVCRDAFIGGQMIIMFSVCMATSNALSLALANYKWCIGTASSLFGLGHYCIISLFTIL